MLSVGESPLAAINGRRNCGSEWSVCRMGFPGTCIFNPEQVEKRDGDKICHGIEVRGPSVVECKSGSGGDWQGKLGAEML